MVGKKTSNNVINNLLASERVWEGAILYDLRHLAHKQTNKNLIII